MGKKNTVTTEATSEPKKSNRVRVLEFIQSNPNAKNKDIATALNLKPNQVASIKSLAKAKDKPTDVIDLNTLRAAIPQIVALGGVDKITTAIEGAKGVVEVFGSLDRAAALVSAFRDFQTALAPETPALKAANLRFSLDLL